MQPMISFILPIYNTDELVLRTCLERLSEFISKQIEIILIDDGSEPYIKEIVKEYLTDSRFSYVFQRNEGVSSARNHGLTHAHGEWVFFIDSDDSLTEDAEKIFVDNINKCRNSDVILFNYREINSQTGEVLKTVPPVSVNSEKWSNLDNEKLLLAVFRTPETEGEYSGYYLGMPWGKLIKREILNRNAIRFPADITKREDALFAVELYSCRPKVSYVSEVVYGYQTNNSDSLSKKYDPELPFMFVKLLRQLLMYKDIVEDQAAFDESFSIYCFDLTKELVNLCFCNQNNPAAYKARRQEFLDFIRKPEFATYFQSVPSFKGPLWKKILFQVIRSESFVLLNSIYMMRKVQNFLRRRGNK